MKKSFGSYFIAVVTCLVCLVFTFQPAFAEVKNLDAGAAFTVSVDSEAKSGIAGSVVSYKITITNVSATDPLDISISNPVSISTWDPAPTINQNSLSLAAGASSVATVDVPIPTSATAGQNDKERVTISDGTTTVTQEFTTTVKTTESGGRPVLMVAAYYVNNGKIGAGEDFELALKLNNTGGSTAKNIVVSFDGGTSFFPKNTGGIVSAGYLNASDKKTIKQSFSGALEIAWLEIVTIRATVSYTDAAGTAYSDVFSLTFEGGAGSSSGSYATATPAASNQPQLVVTNYKTNVDILEPGTMFKLTLDIQDMGQTDANAVTMVVGGGATPSSSESGTPQPGGVSGSGSELTNFAPLNSSNLVYIGNIHSGTTVTAEQNLIVNVTTEPGVYTLKLSFVYTDSKGNRIVDDQVITLLVYSLPKLEVNFYRDPGMFYAGMSNVLPIQITNLGKKTTVLGNMKVTANGADITNNVSLVGALDPGGYYTLDADILPMQEGPIDVVVTINYNDDFNQARTVEQKISIEVQPAMEEPTDISGVDENGNPITENPVEPVQETFWQKIGRFFKGLFGLDSSAPSDGTIPTDNTTPEQAPVFVGPKG